MTDIAALDRLIEAVEAGTLGWNGIANACEVAGIGLREAQIAASAYNGSFDAFMALKEALAPDWAIDQMASWPGGKSFVRLIGTHVEDDGERWHSHKDGRAEGESENLARAGLLALLRAHRAQIGGQ